MLWKYSSKKIVYFIIILALLLRLVYIPYAKFENETARDISIAKNIIEEKKIRLVGVTGEIEETSTQQSFGPIYYYLIGLPLLFWWHPYAAVLATIIASILAILLCYALVRKFFDKDVALIATVLFAFNPWFFAFISLNTNTPSFIIPFVLLLFYGIYHVIISQNEKYMMLIAVAAALLLQIHLSSVVILVAALVLLAVMKPKALVSKYTFIGAGLMGISLLPFIIFNSQQGSFASVFSFLTHRYDAAVFENLRDATAIPFMLGTTYFGKYLLGGEQIFTTSFTNYSFLFFDIMLVIAIFSGVCISLLQSMNKKLAKQKRKTFMLLVTWFIFPIVFAILSSTNISPHYMYITYPAQFIFIAITLKHIIKKRTKAYVLAGAVVLLYLVYLASFFSMLDKVGGTDGIYGIPLNKKIDVLQYLEEQNISEVYTYRSVKPEYRLIKEMLSLNIDIKALKSMPPQSGEYLLLDWYSRGNFAEQTLTREEKESLRKYPAAKVGKIEIVTTKQ